MHPLTEAPAVTLRHTDFYKVFCSALGVSPRTNAEIISSEPDFDQGILEFIRDWQLHHLLRKSQDLDIGVNTRQVALDEFNRCESECAVTNDLFLNNPLGRIPSSVLSILLSARSKIARVLGPVPDVADLPMRFGKGNSFGCRRIVTPAAKLESPLQLTFNLRPLLLDLERALPHWLDSSKCYELVHGSELSFVPKSAKTDRPICTEPIVNGFLQLGIGSYMKNCLKRVGVDLSDQSRNQQFALLGRQFGMTTIDLSSASDLVSFGLVYFLLPIEWVELLDRARSHRYWYLDRWTEFEKFSSMGCGFTFELESLIFWALSRSVVDRLAPGMPISIYGDDIIVPDGCYATLVEVLSTCGFRLNERKSFTGLHPFRESCGVDAYFGIDVTPFRLQETIKVVPDVFALANGLTRWFYRCGHAVINYQTYQKVWRWVVHHVPERCRVYGPSGHGDGHLHVPISSGRAKRIKPRGKRLGWEGWIYSTYVWIPMKQKRKTWSTAVVLYTVYQRPAYPDVVYSDGFPLRDRGAWKLRRAFTHDWVDFPVR